METRALIGGRNSRQCGPSSVKVIPTHKKERSLFLFFFLLVINRPDRIGPRNPIKNRTEVLLPVALFHSQRFTLSGLSLLLDQKKQQNKTKKTTTY